MKKYLSYQLNLFLLALSFFSRLPMPQTLQYSPSKMRRASRYFPLVGWLLALLLTTLYYLAEPLIGTQPSVCLILIASLLLTGALHEDGLADTCDGFWGGYNKDKKLAIMKDSRIGTYGTCALILALLSKFVLLSALADNDLIWLGLFIAYPLSRTMAITLVQDMRYVSNRMPVNGSKSEPLAKPFSISNLIFVVLSGAAACVLLPFLTACLLLLGCLTSRYALRFWMNKHIGGYTGDCLGTAQQLQELFIYSIILSHLGMQP